MDNQALNNEATEVTNHKSARVFSTRRRATTALLVLIAALLLGYVLYSNLFMPSRVVDISNTPTSVPREYTEAEKRAILESLQAEAEAETLKLTTEQKQERRSALESLQAEAEAETLKLTTEQKQERRSALEAMVNNP